MRDPYDIIKTARITEKGTSLSEKNRQYVFEVDKKATKQEIKFAIQRIFNKGVMRVNTMNVRPKVKRTRNGGLRKTDKVKKAVVMLKTGETLELT